MAHLLWNDNLNTGIDVIDGQHRQIVEYINQLDDIRKSHDRQVVAEVLEELVDYTLSHFGFEEALMEDVGYEFLRPHKKVHEIFIKRISEYRLRFEAGEDIVEDLHSLLARWLFSHIKNDDASYASVARQHMKQLTSPSPLSPVTSDTEQPAITHAHDSWLNRTLGRFFK